MKVVEEPVSSLAQGADEDRDGAAGHDDLLPAEVVGLELGRRAVLIAHQHLEFGIGGYLQRRWAELVVADHQLVLRHVSRAVGTEGAGVHAQRTAYQAWSASSLRAATEALAQRLVLELEGDVNGSDGSMRTAGRFATVLVASYGAAVAVASQEELAPGLRKLPMAACYRLGRACSSCWSDPGGRIVGE